MNKLKILLGYLFTFILSMILLVIISLLIVKLTIGNKQYLKNKLVENDYYASIALDIKEEMEDFMTSSGLPKDVLDDIYTLEEVQNDIDNYLNSFYVGEKYAIEKEELKTKLLENINTYLKENNFQITDSEEMTSFITEMEKIYQNKITLYGSLDSFTTSFSKMNSVVSVTIIILIIIFIAVLIMVIKTLKVEYWHSIFIASGLMLLFIRLFILEKIDIENILLFSEFFSKVLQKVIMGINDILLTISIILFIFGILFSFCLSLCQPKRNKDEMVEI